MYRIYCNSNKSSLHTILFQRLVPLIMTKYSSLVLETGEENLLKKSFPGIKAHRKSLMNELQKMFNIAPIDAFTMIMNNRNLSRTKKPKLVENYCLLQAHKISNETILRYPALLGEVDLDEKIKMIEGYTFDTNEVAPLLLLTLKELKQFIEDELSVYKRNRLAKLSSILETDIRSVCDILRSKPFLQTLSPVVVEDKVRILRKFKISPEEVCRDLWVLKYSADQIEKRLKKAMTNKIEDKKTWMVRAQEDIFENYIKRRSDNKSILGDSTLTEYLSRKLECTEEMAKYIVLKQPALKKKSLKKIELVINFLLEENFKADQIVRVPKLLVHGVDRMKKRLRLLEAKGLHLETLSVLTKSQKQFAVLVEALVKRTNRKQ